MMWRKSESEVLAYAAFDSLLLPYQDVSGADDMIKEATDESVRDAVIIASAQRVEHYEIASYGTVRNWAKILGENRHAQILNDTLQEEGHADQLLTSISDRVNPYAQKAA